VSERTVLGSDQSALLREPSRHAVLREIRASGEIARHVLSERLGLSPATVTAATADLISAGFIRELDKPGENAPSKNAPGKNGPGENGSPRRGRPPVHLGLDPSIMRFAGAKISNHTVTAVILDFLGGIVGRADHPIEPGNVAPGYYTQALCSAVDAALRTCGLNRDDVGGLGIGVPGFIDQQTGLIHWSPFFPAINPGFQSEIQALWPCPVQIENDANLATLAELRAGMGRGEDNFLTVTIEHGVGLGLVIDGKLFRGARGIGAEFGHTKVQYDGALCRCGQRGCLEAYVADYALVREASTIFDMPAPQIARSDADILLSLQSAAAGGDHRAQDIFNRAARMLGMGIGNLVNIMDPPLIILSGEQMRHSFLFVEEMKRALTKNMLQIDRPAPDIQIHRWGELLWAQGGAILATEHWIQSLGK